MTAEEKFNSFMDTHCIHGCKLCEFTAECDKLEAAALLERTPTDAERLSAAIRKARMEQ